MKERILLVFKRTFELETVDESISQKNCDKWDSMNHLNLIVEFETEFEITIEPEEMGIMKDFKTIETIISRKL
ncbi:MAG TPA: acyl carrier protein [Bacteroidales bacterium]|nr:MAG: D-alanine--poly(phosphoribitol) ligase subunit 2 [Bacteroidetes bacterium ADurb.Bin217]HRS19664.1 acyl carrier protein [Bacteroidales bacterium]